MQDEYLTGEKIIERLRHWVCECGYEVKPTDRCFAKLGPMKYLLRCPGCKAEVEFEAVATPN